MSMSTLSRTLCLVAATVFARTASAAPLAGRLDGAPFDAAVVLAGPDPAFPGGMWVALLGRPATCGQLLADKTAKQKHQRAVMVGFAEATTGAAAILLFVADGPDVTGTATLVSVPEEVGGTGVIELSITGEGTRLSGTVRYELCAAIPPRPSVEGTRFEPVLRTLSETGDSPGELQVHAAVPTGWSEVPPDRYRRHAVWAGPDGASTFELALQHPMRDFAAETAAWAAMQAPASGGPDSTNEILASAQDTGAFVLRWRRRWQDEPWTYQLDVFRQDVGWPHAVKCSLKTDEAGAAALFDAAQAACLGLARGDGS